MTSIRQTTHTNLTQPTHNTQPSYDDEEFKMSLVVNNALSQLYGGSIISSSAPTSRYQESNSKYNRDDVTHHQIDWFSPWFSEPSYTHTINIGNNKRPLKIHSGDDYDDGIAVIEYSYYCPNKENWVTKKKEFKLDKNITTMTNSNIEKEGSRLLPFLKDYEMHKDCYGP